MWTGEYTDTESNLKPAATLHFNFISSAITQLQLQVELPYNRLYISSHQMKPLTRV